ncbi:MAG: hypothetical protein LAN37_11210 [Acidobacteriia bacterium]|nr:hypothetical protein [Terriglobia bacterium]
MPKGICVSEENRCGLSFRNHEISYLLERLEVIRARELRGEEVPQEFIGYLRPFARYFQDGAFCLDCGGALQTTTLPNANLDRNGDEFRRRSDIIRLLGVLPELQNRGIIPYDF